ncbi:MAG: ribosome silencing factor [Elusimicrobiaceae bacterium]|nr:ribosome silencing factor [Elusimicrobiaceae bacterium]
MNVKEMVCLAARLADEKKAENIRVVDLGGLSSLCEFVLIVTATSKPHLDAIEEEISKKLKEQGFYKLNRDGRESNLWRVSDYGGFLVHIMTAEARDFYALDKIFSFGKIVDFTKPIKKTTAKKTSKKTVAKKAGPKKTAAKKTVAPKAAVKKPVVKKTISKKTTKKK